MAVIDRLSELTRPTGEEDLLDIAYPTPRVTITPRQAIVAAAAVVLVVALWAGWAFLRPAPEAPAEPDLAELPAVAAESEAPPTEMVVSVVGAVAQPGLVTLAPGARIADALAATGPLPEADLVAVNQAQLLVDGQQIHIPAVGDAPPAPAPAAPAAGGGGASGGTVSLNSADAAALTTLDGVGEATAQAIIDHRTEIGGFTAIEQLQDVKGIGAVKFEQLRDKVSL